MKSIASPMNPMNNEPRSIKNYLVGNIFFFQILSLRLSILDAGSLLISEVQASRAGKYECSAQTMAGSRNSSPATLKVLAPPKVLGGPQDTEVIKGLDLPC